MASFFRAQVFSLLRQDDSGVLKKGTFAFKLKFYINKFCFKKSHNKNILAWEQNWKGEKETLGRMIESLVVFLWTEVSSSGSLK